MMKSGKILFPLLFCVAANVCHSSDIIPDETGDRLAIAQMSLDDFRNIRGLHMAIPHAFGIDHHHGTFVAQPHATASGELNIADEAVGLYLMIECLEHSDRSAGRTRRHALWLLLLTDEQMKAKRFHRGLLAPC